MASGRFDQAEFATDLFEVYSQNTDEEYQDPKAFFARTYLTHGLRDLLVGAARRLSGDGGDPVIELQANFGGGKTHGVDRALPPRIWGGSQGPARRGRGSRWRKRM